MAKHPMILELYYDGDWHPAPAYVRDGMKLTRGVTSPQSQAEPATAILTLDNRSGDYSPRSIASSLYGKIGQNTPCRITIDGHVRLTGEVSLWKPERVKGDAWTRLEVSGPLRRIGRGVEAISSAARRFCETSGALGYWPMEPDSRHTNVVDEARPLQFPGTEIEYGVYDGPAGSDKGPKFFLNDDRPPVSQVYAPIEGTSDDWKVNLWFRAHAGPKSDVFFTPVVDFIEIATTGTVAYWAVEALSYPDGNQFEVTITGYESNGDIISPTFGAVVDTEIIDDAWHMVTIVGEQIGGNAYISINIDDGLGSGVSNGAWTNGQLAGIWLPKRLDPSNVADPSMMHLVAYDSASGALTTLLYDSARGWPGELAADRFLRICAEQGIDAAIVGDADDTIAMGPQRVTTLLDQLAEIERTDDANIYEARDSIGLVMRTGASKLNQTPALTISYIAQIEPTLTPVFGDEGIRNDVTANAPTGGQARVQQLTGPHNVQLPEDDPQGVGRYQTRIEVNPAADGALRDAAGWRVNLGTYDGTWYASITADLDAAPSLTATVNALDIGDVIELTDLPVDEALEAVQSVIIGIHEDVLSTRRTVTFFCVPADPYRVGLLSETSGDTDPFVGHLETDDSTTVGSTAPGATSFTVATNSGPRWITDSDDFPFDVIAGGQRVSITSIAGASSPQTFNVDPSGRQVVYTIPAGSSVFVQQPIIVSL